MWDDPVPTVPRDHRGTIIVNLLTVGKLICTAELTRGLSGFQGVEMEHE